MQHILNDRIRGALNTALENNELVANEHSRNNTHCTESKYLTKKHEKDRLELKSLLTWFKENEPAT